MEASDHNQAKRAEERRYSSRFDPTILDRTPATRERFRRYFQSVIGPDRPAVVLDMGCGTGMYHSVLAPLVSSLVAVDRNPEMLRRARKLNEERALATEFLHADAERLPFSTGTFDLVLAYDFLHHVRDIRVVADEIHRVLRPGGRFAAAETTMLCPWTFAYNLFRRDEWGALRIRPGRLRRAFSRFDRLRLQPDNVRFFPHAPPLEWVFNLMDRYVLRGPLRSMSARYLIEAWAGTGEGARAGNRPFCASC
jgi:SAM-dependent methyltransferase